MARDNGHSFEIVGSISEQNSLLFYYVPYLKPHGSVMYEFILVFDLCSTQHVYCTSFCEMPVKTNFVLKTDKPLILVSLLCGVSYSIST